MDGPAARQRARRHATLAIGLLVAAAFALRFGPGRGIVQEQLLPWVLVALGAYAALAILWWAAAVLRHPRPDPWEYDAELDGPVAEAMEGRSYLRPDGAPPPSIPVARTALLLGLAVLFLLAGAWLVAVAGTTFAAGNGAEGPSLTALAFYLCAAAFLLAGPWLAWRGLRRAR
ncbi:MAG: hypothetical protein QOG31_985 [Thermoplasmata archaeon]|jgi:hypothetical protein|nr:hypothetical protein [Thermoplasmata archaeon]